MEDPTEDLLKSMRKSVRSLNGRLDNEAGRIGENITMIDLASQGYNVKYVGNDKSKHYDIHATRGKEELHVENKAGLHSDLSDAEKERAKRDPKYRVKRTPRLMPRL
jgi:predicted AAA+ superfamily ATPase